MADNNPHQFSTQTTNVTFAQITDDTDFPHTGLIKALSLMGKGNMALKGSVTDFDITQATTGNVVVVKSGKIYRDGALHTIPSGGADTNFTSSAFDTSTGGNSYYHLLVADSSNTLQIRKHGSSTANRVPEYDEGDTIIAVIMFNSTSAPLGSMQIQFLTTSKVSNNLNIGYSTGTAPNDIYNEAMSIEGSATRTLFKNKVADADIRFVLADNTADERFEIYSDDDSDGDEGDTALFTVNGLGATSIAGTVNLGSVANAGTDTDKFLVLDSGGNVDFRTGTEVRSDIGAGTLSAESDTLDLVTGRGNTTGNSITCANVTATAGLVGDTATATTALTTNGLMFKRGEAFSATLGGGVPVAPTFTTSIIYIHDATGNAFTLPPPSSVANSVFTIRNLGTATTAITVLGGGKIDFVPSIAGTSLTGHRLVNVADQIDLPVGDTVVVHAVSDGNPAPLQDSYYIISP